MFILGAIGALIGYIVSETGKGAAVGALVGAGTAVAATAVVAALEDSDLEEERRRQRLREAEALDSFERDIQRLNQEAETMVQSLQGYIKRI